LISLAALLASIHALLHKRDSRAATLWLATIWFLPLLGSILYITLGVNRIRRRALSLGVHATTVRQVPEHFGESQLTGVEHLEMLARVIGSRRRSTAHTRQPNSTPHQRR